MKMYVCPIVIAFLLISIFGFSCKKNGTEPETELLELQLIPTHVSVYDGSDGGINLIVTGGITPYQYQWSNGETTEDITNLSAGMYSVIVTDSDKQTAFDSVEISQPDNGTITDIDGNVYKIIKIGDQWWMAENLRVTHDSKGNAITSYVYTNNENMALVYGRLYTWEAMMNGSSNPGAQGIAPDGWHIPSIEEWQILIDYLGGNDIAGGKMKEQGTEHWASPNVGATNSSGLTLVASGSYVVSQNRYCDLKAGAHILTSSSEGANGIFVAVASHAPDIGSATISKNDIAFSVRCVKD